MARKKQTAKGPERGQKTNLVLHRRERAALKSLGQGNITLGLRVGVDILLRLGYC